MTMSLQFHIWSCVLAFFLLSPIRAAEATTAPRLDPDKELRRHVLDVWTMEDGLPSNTIFDIVQDEDGYLWLATVSGLVRFDGIRFTTFDTTNVPTLGSYLVRDLHLDTDGSLWIASDGGGLIHYSNGSFEAFTKEDGFPSDHTVAVVGDPSGTLWVGFEKGQISRFRNRVITNIGLARDLAPADIQALHVSADGSLWITDGPLPLPRPEPRVLRYRNGKLESLSIPNAPTETTVWHVFSDDKGVLWASTHDTRRFALFRFVEGEWETVDLPVFLEMARAMYVDRGGTLWLAGGGVYRFTNGRLDKLTPVDGLPDTRVRAFYQDREGNLWVGTNNAGLLRIKNGRDTHYSPPYENMLTLYQSRNGILWGGNEDGLMRFENGEFRVVHAADGKRMGLVRSIAEDDGGALWLATDIGLVRFLGGSTKLFTTAHGLPANDIHLVYADREGCLWLSLHRPPVVVKFEDGVFSRVEYFEDEPVRAIHQDTGGTIWFGLDKGPIHYLKAGQFARVDQAGSATRVRAFHEDDRGRLWMATWGAGLFRLKDGVLTNYTKKDGLHSDMASWILADDEGVLWMSTDQGIYGVNKKSIEDYDAGRLDRIPIVVHGRDEGLKSLECDSHGFPSGWKTTDGRLWFTMFKGAAAVGPVKIENPLPPPVRVEEIQAGGRPVAEQELASISPGRRDLEIHYTAPSLRYPEKVRFKYQLVGYDDDWVDAGNRRVAYYTHVPPGTFQFRVMAANESGVWNEQGATRSLTLLPYFHETLWFRSLSILLLGALLYGAHRMRAARVERRALELESLVSEKEHAQIELKRIKDRIEQENLYLRDEVQKNLSEFDEIAGQSGRLKEVLLKVQQVAPTETTVLLTGETGTGKELVARAIHRRSPRKTRSLITVNCAALLPTLIESELFGHEKGAFTGATERRIGRFELADRATIFLDEIGELDMSLQAKFLRVLQEGELERVGLTNTRKVDVRVIAATNQNLEKAIEEGRFREDLFYRLNVFSIGIPPLRERREDIPLLVWYFLGKKAVENRKTIDKIPAPLMDALQSYDWPGNIRELQNVIERAVITSAGSTLWLDATVGPASSGLEQLLASESDLAYAPVPPEDREKVTPNWQSLEDMDRSHIVSVLTDCEWRISGQGNAADRLDLNPSTLRTRMKKLGIEVPRQQQENAPSTSQTLRDKEREHILSVLEQTGWKIAGQGNAAERLAMKPSTLRFRMKKLGIERSS